MAEHRECGHTLVVNTHRYTHTHMGMFAGGWQHTHWALGHIGTELHSHTDQGTEITVCAKASAVEKCLKRKRESLGYCRRNGERWREGKNRSLATIFLLFLVAGPSK